MYIIANQPLVSGDNTCGVLLNGCGNTTAHDWTIGDLPGTKPPVVPPSLPDVGLPLNMPTSLTKKE